ncbi:MAG: GNAT family N-acetyltransferase [Clostridia bacterium]|nr:GNAT family N-acetyltransferase [Clostridia bacterium]
MLIRKLTKDDFEQFSEVSASAYVYNAEETTFVEDVDNFGAFINDGKTLISQLECGFKHNFYCGKKIGCAAIGGVASKPEYRRMGGVRATFNTVFQYAIDEGAIVSILYPFSIEYYKKFGYETILKCVNVECSFKTFEGVERFNEVTLAREEHKDIIKSIYTEVAQKQNMLFARDNYESFCFTPYKSCRYTYFVNRDDARGYVTFTLNRATRMVTVSELLFNNKTALLNLLGFIKIYDGNYDTVHFDKLPVSSPVLEVIKDENRLVKRMYTYEGAARILDVEKVLEATQYPKEKGCFSVKITDNQIDKNNGVFTVSYEDGKCTIQKESSTEFDIALDILGASRIILGREGLTLDEISYISNVEIRNDCEDFLRAFPKKTTVFYDGF